MSGSEQPALRVWVEPATCIGSDNCVRLACGAFALNGAGVAEVIDPGVVDEERIRLVERSCPTGAIQIESR